MTHARFAKLGLAGLLGLALVGGAAVQAAETKPPVSAGKRWESEFSLWQKVSASSDPAGYEGYLKQYPNGTFASMARLRLAELNAAGVDKPTQEQTGTIDAGQKASATAEKEKAKAAEAQRLEAEQEIKVAAEKAQAEEQRLAAEAERKREAEAVEAERRKAEQQAKAEELAKAAAEAKANADMAATARAKAEAEQAAAEAERKRAEAAAEAGRLKAEQEARAASEAQARADTAAADKARAEAALAAAEAERARAEEAAAAEQLKVEEAVRANAAAKGALAAPETPGSADALDTEALPTEPEAAPDTNTVKSADVQDNSATQSGSTGGAAASGTETPAPGSDATTAKAADADAERLARREDNSWSRAILSGKRDAYQSYLGEFPNGRFAAEARQRLAAMDKETGEGGAAAAEAETKAGTAKPAGPDATTGTARSADSDATAGTAKAADAEASEQLARREDNSWSRAILSGSRDAFESYLGEFPNGRFAAEARQRLADIGKESGDSAGTGVDADTGNVVTRQPDTGNVVPGEPDTGGVVTRAPATAQPQPKVYQTPPDVREAWLDPGTRARSQRYLNALGYGTGGADGVFGPRTRAAIASWQRSLGLRADGYLTRKQYRQLHESAQFAENRNRQRAAPRRYQNDPYYGDGYVLEGPAGGYYEGPVDGYYEGPVDRGGPYLGVPGY